MSLSLSGMHAMDASSTGSSGAFIQESNRLSSHQAENYTIRPGDVVLFKIYGEDDTLTEVRVSSDGLVSLPYLESPVRLAGLTIIHAKEYLFVLYEKDLYVNPHIYIAVKEYSVRRIQILGQVNRPGFAVIPPEKELTLLQAIAAAGGFTRLADTRRLTLKRQLPDGNVKVMEIDAQDIMKNSEALDFPVREGDTIIVPERRI